MTLREEWDVDQRRILLSRIVPIYRKRGTKAGLRELLETAIGESAATYEFDEPLHYFQSR